MQLKIWLQQLEPFHSKNLLTLLTSLFPRLSNISNRLRYLVPFYSFNCLLYDLNKLFLFNNPVHNPVHNPVQHSSPQSSPAFQSSIPVHNPVQQLDRACPWESTVPSEGSDILLSVLSHCTLGQVGWSTVPTEPRKCPTDS